MSNHLSCLREHTFSGTAIPAKKKYCSYYVPGTCQRNMVAWYPNKISRGFILLPSRVISFSPLTFNRKKKQSKKKTRNQKIARDHFFSPSNTISPLGSFLQSKAQQHGFPQSKKNTKKKQYAPWYRTKIVWKYILTLEHNFCVGWLVSRKIYKNCK